MGFRDVWRLITFRRRDPAGVQDFFAQLKTIEMEIQRHDERISSKIDDLIADIKANNE